MGPLTPERWQSIEPILDDVLELVPEQRARYLAAACEGDADLRSDIERLLAADSRAGGFLEVPISPSAVAALGCDAAHEARPASVGERIGPYRVVAELAHGGMGVVYLAERADGSVEQRVALKLIRRRLAGEDALRRFRREHQILAGLHHPNIVRLLDEGVAADGRAYFVMEYVEGAPITRFCDEHRLGINDRIRLFTSVCSAVQHAHDQQTVHRDLKPANILVAGTGAVKLVDFGIARRLEDSSDKPGLARAAHLLMTPAYAAPELLRHEPATAATDVYGLGVVLHELLYRHRPYDPGQIHSTRPGQLRRRLPAALDAIMLRAIARNPMHRYASVAALGDDLLRYLDGTGGHLACAGVETMYNTWAAGLSSAIASVLLACSLFSCTNAAEPPEATLLISDVHVFDVDSGTFGSLTDIVVCGRSK